MKNTFQISLSKRFGETLNTRQSAKLLFELIENEKVQLVDFDFSNIEFMSRSFADQFHKERVILKNDFGLNIQISNAEESIRMMLNTVEKTQKKSSRFYQEIPVYNFTEESKLVDYLWSI